jgi:hypothetical protein
MSDLTLSVLEADHPFCGVAYDWFCNHLSFWPAVRFLDNLFAEVGLLLLPLLLLVLLLMMLLLLSSSFSLLLLLLLLLLLSSSSLQSLL